MARCVCMPAYASLQDTSHQLSPHIHTYNPVGRRRRCGVWSRGEKADVLSSETRTSMLKLMRRLMLRLGCSVVRRKVHVQVHRTRHLISEG